MDTEIETPTRSYEGVTTADIVKEMLTENTGSHFLDSGGAYGRNWSRNQGRDFAAEPKVSTRWSVWRPSGEPGAGRVEMMATVSLYHWLMDHFEFDAELQTELDQFAAEHPDSTWLDLSEEFAEHLHSQGRCDEEPNVVNTYNDPDNIDLSQVLQFTKVYLDGDYEPSHLIINVHGGCDVRGGYASPKVLKIDQGGYHEALEHASVHIVTAGDHYWDYHGCRLTDHSENAPDNDILNLPCYDPDWIAATSEDPRLAGLQQVIHAINTQRQALRAGDTDLSVTQLADALGQLDAAEKDYNEAYLQAVAEILADEHPVCTFVHEHKLFLVIADPNGLSEVHAVHAHNE